MIKFTCDAYFFYKTLGQYRKTRYICNVFFMVLDLF